MLTIIGCGNLNRSDDGVGVVVAQRLATRLAQHPVPGVRVFDCGTAGVDVMFKARGSDALLIFDACKSGSPPGTIYDVPGEELASEHEPSFNLHDFRWDHALAAGRKIFRDEFPSNVQVWLVEAASVDYGLELGTEVTEAADELYRRALRVIAEHSANRHEDAHIEVELHRGSLRLTKETYDRFFDGRDGVILLDKDDRVLVIPVEDVTGGLLLKQRNLRGDRVVHAHEFLEARGVDRDDVRALTAVWDGELGALALSLSGDEGTTP